jgi:glutamate racemase
LKSVLKRVSGNKVQLIDSAQETAKEVKDLLSKKHHRNPSNNIGKAIYYVTDNPAGFSRLGRQFLGNGPMRARRLHLENL